MTLERNRLKSGAISYTIKIRLKGVAYREHLGPIPKKAAEQRNREAKLDARRGLWPKRPPPIPIPTIPTLKAFAESRFLPWYAEDHRPTSVKRITDRYRLHLEPKAGGYTLDEIDTSRIDRYRSARLAEGAARNTINGELDTLGHMLTQAKEWGVLPLTHVAKVHHLRVEKREHRILSDTEASALLLAANAHLRPLIGFALMTGLRRNELITLQWRDLDFTTNEVIVQSDRAKSTKSRRIPLNQTALAILADLPKPLDLRQRVFGYTTLDKSVRQAAERAGLSGVTCHTLRRTFGTNALRLTGNIRLVQKWLGHASITTTQDYLHPLPQHEREGIERLSLGLHREVVHPGVSG